MTDVTKRSMVLLLSTLGEIDCISEGWQRVRWIALAVADVVGVVLRSMAFS